MSECLNVTGFPYSFSSIIKSFLSARIRSLPYTNDFLRACCHMGDAETQGLLFEMFPDTIAFPAISVGNESSLACESYGAIKCVRADPTNDLCGEFHPTIFSGEDFFLKLILKNNLRIPLNITVVGVVFMTVDETEAQFLAQTDAQSSTEIMPLCEGSMTCGLELKYDGPTHIKLYSILFSVNGRKFLVEKMSLPQCLVDSEFRLSNAREPRISINLVEFRSSLSRSDTTALIMLRNSGNAVAESVDIIFASKAFNLPPLWPGQTTEMSLPFVRGNQNELSIMAFSRSHNRIIGLEIIPHDPSHRIDISSINIRYGSIVLFRNYSYQNNSTSQVANIQSGSSTYDILPDQMACIYSQSPTSGQVVMHSGSHIERLCSRVADLH